MHRPSLPKVSLLFFEQLSLVNWLARPAGTAMPPAGLCFTDDFLFLNVAPLIRQRMQESQRGLLR